MTHWEFFALLIEHWLLYLIALFLSGFLTFLIARRYTNSWFDPFRIGFVFVAFANAVPLFLYFIGRIESNDFFYFLTAETFFWIGFLILAKRNITFSNRKFVNERGVASVLNYIFLFFYIVCTGLTYIIQGIPLLMKSRLNLYTDSGGLAVLGRMAFFFEMYCLFYNYYLWDSSKKISNRVLVILTVSIFIITAVLSGSKGSFLYLIFTFWGYNKFYKGKSLAGGKYFKYFIPAIIVGVIVLVVQTEDSIVNGVFGFFTRFISTGDIYWMSYPNETYRLVSIPDWFSNFFQGFFGPMRLIDYQKAGTILGYQVEWLVYPNLDGFSAGPNSRLPVLGYIYFGWWGILFSFINGLFVSLIAYRTASLFPKGIISAIVCTYIYIQVFSMVGDTVTGMSNLFDMFLNVIILFFVLLVITIFWKEEVTHEVLT